VGRGLGYGIARHVAGANTLRRDGQQGVVHFRDLLHVPLSFEVDQVDRLDAVVGQRLVVLKRSRELGYLVLLLQDGRFSVRPVGSESRHFSLLLELTRLLTTFGAR
jgi:hypothetical protein